MRKPVFRRRFVEKAKYGEYTTGIFLTCRVALVKWANPSYRSYRAFLFFIAWEALDLFEIVLAPLFRAASDYEATESDNCSPVRLNGGYSSVTSKNA